MINQHQQQLRLFPSRARREKMENSILLLRCRNHPWLFVLSLFVLWYFLLYVHDWSSFSLQSLAPLVAHQSRKESSSNLIGEDTIEINSLSSNFDNSISNSSIEKVDLKLPISKNRTESANEEEDQAVAEIRKEAASDNPEVEKIDVQKKPISYSRRINGDECPVKEGITKKPEKPADAAESRKEAAPENLEVEKKIDQIPFGEKQTEESANTRETNKKDDQVKETLTNKPEKPVTAAEEIREGEKSSSKTSIAEGEKVEYQIPIGDNLAGSREIHKEDQAKEALRNKPEKPVNFAENTEGEKSSKTEEEKVDQIPNSDNKMEPSANKEEELLKEGHRKKPDKPAFAAENREGEKSSETESSQNTNENNKGEDPVKQALTKKPEKPASVAENREEPTSEDPCLGRYIYIHKIPTKFNDDLIEHCNSLNSWSNMCKYLMNLGLGDHLYDRTFSRNGWFDTNQFSLEVIFRNRMNQYKCLTDVSSKASAIFVPYFSGLDVARYLWGYNCSMRDSGAIEVNKWLREQPEWQVMWGRDHFMVAGRISWDFRREIDIDAAWGNKLMHLPESLNLTILTIESSPWNNNDFAIPYPTYFHPSSDSEIVEWQYKMRRIKRQYLFSFAGAPRPNLENSIRGQIMGQCQASRQNCMLLECKDKFNKCLKPVYLMKMFMSSVFCLQPPGDSYTRRSTFDSIVAGCIPVFFHPGSAYVQYLWHLPKNYRKYSVLIPEGDVKENKLSIEAELQKIPRAKIVAMREEVIKLIPKVIYANPSSRLETAQDAFDLTVKGVIERVEKMRRDMREGRNSSFDLDEEYTWKYNFFGNARNNEWDHFFERRKNVGKK